MDKIELVKISDVRWESTDGDWAIVEDFADTEDWHILNGDDNIVAGVKANLSAAIGVLGMLTGKTVEYDTTDDAFSTDMGAGSSLILPSSDEFHI